MTTLCISLIFLSLALTSAAKITLTAQYFQLAGSTQPSVKLSWFDTSKTSQYHIYRKSDEGEFKEIASLSGNTYDDYQVPTGQLVYSISPQSGDPASSDEVKISTEPFSGSQNFLTFDNVQFSSLQTISRIKLDQKYYQYSVQSDKNGVSKIVEATSSDGYQFTGETREVLTGQEICAGSVDGCKLEAVTFFQNPKTLEVVMWAHWEYKGGYAEARVAVAFGMPGGTWRFGGSFRPLGHDSRDLTFFQDDDGTGYIISSTSVNTDMNIYQLSPDLHNVTSLVATVLKGQRREAPMLIKHKHVYYLFTSQAAGWYPSLGQYISATNIAGPWSESRNIGNLAGFGAQSGVIQKLGSTYVMCANQWKAQWLQPEPPNRQIVLPISLEDGWAQYYFYEQLRYLDDDERGGVFGVQSGKVLVGKPIAATGISLPNSESGLSHLSSTDIELDPGSFFKPPAIPFSYSADLGEYYALTQFDLTTRLTGGSETAYEFTISGATSAKGSYELLVDRRNNTRVGFATSIVNSASGIYRYVKLDIQKVINVHNQNKADWAAGIHQFTIYGQPTDTHSLDQRAKTARASRM